MKYIINSTGIILIINNRPVKVEKNSPKYARILEQLNLPEEEQDDAILDIVLDRVKAQDAVAAGFVITDDEVTYKGESLPVPLAQKIRSIYREGLPLALFEKFWENLNQNPFRSSVFELYDFLAYKELPITEDGCFLAYKGVRLDYYSSTGNKDTRVIKGTVDLYGHIFNGLGETVAVRRWDVDDNRDNTCSHGLHAGSLQYARDFASKCVIVKINPRDVVSVPKDYNCQKLRCCEYTVVADFVEEIVAPVVDKNNEPILNPTHQENKESTVNRDTLVTRIESYLARKSMSVETVTVRQIQNALSPLYPSRTQVLDALQELGYSWSSDDVSEVYV